MPHDPDAGVQSSKPAPRSARSSAAVVFALVLGLLLGVLAIGTLGWLMLSRNSGREMLSHLLSAVTGRTISIDGSQPNVVDRIQRLERLETVDYTMGKMVTGAEEKPLPPDFLIGDWLFSVVDGED